MWISVSINTTEYPIVLNSSKKKFSFTVDCTHSIELNKITFYIDTLAKKTSRVFLIELLEN